MIICNPQVNCPVNGLINDRDFTKENTCKKTKKKKEEEGPEPLAGFEVGSL